MRKAFEYRWMVALPALWLGLTLSSCNKNVPDAVPNTNPTQAGTSIGDIINTNANYSFLKAALTRAGMLGALQDQTKQYTLFAPDNAAFIASGIPSEAVIGALPLTSLVPLLQYHLVAQKITSAQIPATFPNFQYPTFFNPAPTVSALLRLGVHPTTRNGAWINNIPIKAANTDASNGVIHTVAALVAPPSRFLWDRINTDPDMTYLKAAIARADSGVAPTNAASLIGALNNIGANLTVFAPTDSTFRVTLTGAIAQALIGRGIPLATALAQAQALAATPAVFSNPALFSVLTAQTVKGIVVYHVLGQRAFTNNLPTASTNVPTLLNGAVATHPGLGVVATFGTPFVTAATVKGLRNSTPARILIRPLPEPNGSSDQNYLNGVLHKVDQVLMPQ